jgi:hypothetical protein
VTFGSAWALAGLALLAPLILMHLRQRSRREREVPSLLLWHEFQLESASDQRKLRLPPLPLLLLLQALALALLVVTLAQPRRSDSRVAPATVAVVDDSYWMQAPGRMADARRSLQRELAGVPGSEPVRIVLAAGSPTVVYRGDASGAAAALAGVAPSAAPADLPAALRTAGGLLSGSGDRLLVIRAPEDAAPTLQTSPGELKVATAGARVDDQGIFDPQARCGIGSASACEVTATVRNTGSSPVVDHLIAQVPGHRPAPLSVHVGADSTATARVFTAPGRSLNLSLRVSDPIAADDHASVIVPGDAGIPRTSVVTLVGTPATGVEVARALAAVPGVQLRLRTPQNYRPQDARASDVVVVDGPSGHKGLPPAPAVVLLDPTGIPGGTVGGLQPQPTLSGTGPSDGLLDDVDLSALTISTDGARVQALPHWLTPFAWSPSGPLLAAGDNGRVRLVVTAFDPVSSNLGQLGSFPVLVANIVRWSLGWVPSSATAGMPIGVDATPGAHTATLSQGGKVLQRVTLGRRLASLEAPSPGLYTVAEAGPGVAHRATVAVSAGTAAADTTPIDLRSAGLRAGTHRGASWTPWLIVAALVVLALEWSYWSVTRRRGVAA